jgi:hypothetical protein
MARPSFDLLDLPPDPPSSGEPMEEIGRCKLPIVRYPASDVEGEIEGFINNPESELPYEAAP